METIARADMANESVQAGEVVRTQWGAASPAYVGLKFLFIDTDTLLN